jgi:hypothetical protein
MNLASLIVSSLSLVVVTLIGVRSVKTGERSALASEKSAAASESASNSASRAADATQIATDATLRSALASETSAALANQDARIRRLESVLEVVLEMRELFNDQVLAKGESATDWGEPIHSPNALARLALSRKLEGRIVLFEKEFDQTSVVWRLSHDSLFGWRSNIFEEAIESIKEMLRSAVNQSD